MPVARDPDRIDPGPVWRVTFELLPAFAAVGGELLQFREGTDDFEIAGVLRVDPDRQGEAPEALLGDHPVAHVVEPLQLALHAVDAVGPPADRGGAFFDPLPPVHVDEPFIDKPEHEFVAGSPAEGVNVRILLDGEQESLFFQRIKDHLGRGGVDGVFASERSEAFAVGAVGLEGGDDHEAELLADHTMAEPLIAGGVRCHGGFDEDGRYVSPRTKFRVPAIEAWQAQPTALFGNDMLDIPLEPWPEHMPNVAQARHLIKAGVPEPLIATLTRSQPMSRRPSLATVNAVCRDSSDW